MGGARGWGLPPSSLARSICDINGTSVTPRTVSTPLEATFFSICRMVGLVDHITLPSQGPSQGSLSGGGGTESASFISFWGFPDQEPHNECRIPEFLQKARRGGVRKRLFLSVKANPGLWAIWE